MTLAEVIKITFFWKPSLSQTGSQSDLVSQSDLMSQSDFMSQSNLVRQTLILLFQSVMQTLSLFFFSFKI